MRATGVLCGLVVCACGPIQSRTTLVDAAAEVSAARAAQAEMLAPFELVAAEAYLEKAREEQSYADFETAVRFARKSRACAEAARKLALSRAKESFGSASTGVQRMPACRPGPDRGPGATAFDVNPGSPPKPLAPPMGKPSASTEGGRPEEPRDPVPSDDQDLPEGDAESGEEPKR